MGTFAEYVATSFESTVDLFWDHSQQSLVTAKFGVRDIAIRVAFEQSEMDDPWRVGFTVERGDSTSAVYAAFDIFNGVMQALEEFLAIRQPRMLVIVSKNDQLTRIYEAYLAREATRLDRIGYSLEGPIRVDPYTEFLLRRRSSGDWKPLNPLTGE